MAIDHKLLDIQAYEGEGYRPLIDYECWRVAVLRYIDELLPENITTMQRHDETDEVFVLLEGRCILFIGEGSDAITAIHAQDMEPLKLYNVKRTCWHTHTLSEDATVLIVENRNTADHNSPEILLEPDRRDEVVSLAADIWFNSPVQS